MEAFLHGLILALGLILPLGVQNLFVFNQGAAQPILVRAMPVVLTASLCDTLLIILAVMGVSVAILSFSWLKTGLLAVGFFFLLYMGCLAWNSATATKAEENKNGDNSEGNETALSSRQQIAFAASVSLLNPHAILDTIGVIGASSLNYAGEERCYFTFACILVSWCWFFGLACTGRLVGRLERGNGFMGMINKISAIFIWLSAIYMGYYAFSN